MFFERRVNLPIKVVKQTDQAPVFYILAELFGIEPHGGFDRKHMTDKSFIFYVFSNQG